MIELGVNIDHVATLRQARQTFEPDPVAAAVLAEMGGADGITFHLREDRRHIQDRDVEALMSTVHIKTNFELAAAPDVVEIACRVQPDWALLVPESRQEVTTEGGLDIVGDTGRVSRAIAKLKAADILVSLFLDPDVDQVRAAIDAGVDAVELHTGPYALARRDAVASEVDRIAQAGRIANENGIRLHAGHGLNYANVRRIAAVDGMIELNIGHSIVSRSVLVGMQQAVAEMRRVLDLISP